jgi:hypothetical protein
MIDLNDFYNDGFGWTCRHCERDSIKQNNSHQQKQSRLMREGEAESKQPKLSSLALAKWADPAHRVLTCPRCGITELADKL